MAWLAGGLTALTAIGKLGVMPAYRFVKRIGDGVEYVTGQMANNGGSTLKDAIDRTEALAVRTVERLDAIDARVTFLEEIHRKQVEVDAIIEANRNRLAEIRPTLHLPPKES
jgi:hypothetical protein